MPETIHILIQYCNDPRPARQAEYDECVRRNLANPHVARVHNLVEAKTTVPQEFLAHLKYVEQALDHWLTYRDALDYANEKLNDQIICLCNLDIFLDPAGDWPVMPQFLRNNPKVVLCQSRTEFDPNRPPFKDEFLHRLAYANSQDAWIFKAPIAVSDCDFEIGTIGCDNAFAHRVKTAGYIPINAADQYRIFHYDLARGKDAANHLDIHRAERGAERFTRHPEEKGRYYVPNCDQVGSVDEIIAQLDLAPLDKYVIVCEVLSKYLKYRNT